MNKKEFIKSKDIFGYVDFLELIDTYGLDNISKKDLDEIIKVHGFEVTGIVGFLDIYNMKVADLSGKKTTWLTIVIAFFTIVISILQIDPIMDSVKGLFK